MVAMSELAVGEGDFGTETRFRRFKCRISSVIVLFLIYLEENTNKEKEVEYFSFRLFLLKVFLK